MFCTFWQTFPSLPVNFATYTVLSIWCLVIFLNQGRAALTVCGARGLAWMSTHVVGPNCAFTGSDVVGNLPAQSTRMVDDDNVLDCIRSTS
jgi:hypothetical protein